MERPVAAAAQAQGAAAARAWAPDARAPVIIVTGPLGGGKSSVVRHLAARDASSHSYWQDWGTTPPPQRDDGIDRAAF